MTQPVSPGRRATDGRNGATAWAVWAAPPPPGVPGPILWTVWVIGQVGVPVALLLWFVLRADAALSALLAQQYETVAALRALAALVAP